MLTPEQKEALAAKAEEEKRKSYIMAAIWVPILFIVAFVIAQYIMG